MGSALLELHRAELAEDVTVAHLTAVADRVDLALFGVPPPDLGALEVAGDTVVKLLVNLDLTIHLELKTLPYGLAHGAPLGLLHDLVLES